MGTDAGTYPDNAAPGDNGDVTESLEGYTLFSILSREHHRTVSHSTPAEVRVAELDMIVAGLDENGVTVRGFYDVTGMRADADVMIWMHGAVPEDLQAALRELRRTDMFESLGLVWSVMGVHRDAEFNKSHVPGFLRGENAREWLCLYPFVRSYEWYLLPAEERSRMLAEHGRKGAAFTDVVANTVSSFALGDYEWLLPLESDNLSSLVDLMRELRATDARRHVREEVPFYTGRRTSTADLVEVLS